MNGQKKLGLGSGMAICMGLIVATSCLVSLGQGYGLAGKSFTAALVIVAVLNAFIALSFSELNHIMPNVTGGLGQYMLVGLGPWASIVSNISAYAITMVFAASVELAMTGIVLNGLFPAVPAAVFSVAVVLLLYALNLFGVDIFAKVQNVTVILLIGSMAALGIMGVFGLGTGELVSAELVAPPMSSAGDVISLSAIAFWLFIGVEFVIPVSREMKNPRRNVPLSMCLALLVLLVIQSVLGSGMTNYIGTEVLLTADMPHIAYAEQLLGEGGRIWMSIVTLLAAVSTMNTVLPTVGKILQGMSDEGMMPRVFGRTNGRGAPYVGMSLLVVCILIMILTGYVNSGGLINMILAGSCFWLASYILTHLNVLVLRRRYPNAERNKKLMLAGLPQIIGMLGCVYMIWNISSDMDSRVRIYKLFFVLFAALAVFALIWCKAVLKAKPFEPTYIGKMNVDKSINAKTSL
ncbi:MAG: APC family permease [Oscillospiraceae bacterium]|jgi:amino acid transporter|nr:APC family permease [Oscillospiraceae bacterium]